MRERRKVSNPNFLVAVVWHAGDVPMTKELLSARLIGEQREEVADGRGGVVSGEHLLVQVHLFEGEKR